MTLKDLRLNQMIVVIKEGFIDYIKQLFKMPNTVFFLLDS